MNISILGAGAMGAALTRPFTDREHETALWCTAHDEEIWRNLSAGKPHPKLNVSLPKALRVFHPNELEAALQDTELIVLGISTPGILPVLKQLQSVLTDLPPVLTMAKGFIINDDQPWPVPEAVRRELKNLRPDKICPVFSMAGPSIAGELIRRRPTATALSGNQPDGLRSLCKTLATDYFRIDPRNDCKGLEICLAYKNIYAIALAWPEGLEEESDTGNNLAAILMLQVLDELSRLVKADGGDPETVRGWAGLGDLVATSGGGRNGRFGHVLASGCSAEHALEKLEEEGIQTIEGHSALPHGIRYAGKVLGDDWSDQLPLLQGIQNVIEGNITVQEFIKNAACFRKTNLKENQTL